MILMKCSTQHVKDHGHLDNLETEKKTNEIDASLEDCIHEFVAKTKTKISIDFKTSQTFCI